MKPNILNPAWKYVPSDKTDVRKTISRVIRQQKAAQLLLEANKQEVSLKVRTIRGKS